MSGRTVVLTGGTAGIGEALTRRLRQSGDRVIVVGRRPTGHPDSLIGDLRTQTIAEEVEAGLQRLGVSRWDFLIHNAAAGWVGAFPNQSPDDIAHLLRSNVWAPMALTHRLLKTASPTSRVVFVSSPVAHWPSPDYAAYAASKAAIEAFARALRAEGIGAEIHVIRPGATRSEMLTLQDADRLGIEPSRLASPELTAARMTELLSDKPRWTGTDAASSLAEPLRRWVGGRAVSRRPRIAWPSPLLGERSGARSGPSVERTPKALITGAAEGIGRALALRFVAGGYNVVGVDRNVDLVAETRRLVEESHGSATPLIADLSDLQALERLSSELGAHGPFDVVIHNAGINRFGRFPATNLAEQERLYTVNLVAPILLTRELFDRQLLRADARLGFVSSLSHFVGYPGAAVYAATKAGLAAFAEALWWAGREYGFSTTTIFPGPTRTRQAFENSPDNRREHRRADPDVLADSIFKAVIRRKPILIPGRGNRFAAELGRRFPRLTEAMMRRALLDRVTPGPTPRADG